VIKYLGSKRVLLPAIVEAVRSVGSARTVLDLFSGTSRVGHALKREGYRVIANDHNAYAHVLARCYVAADREAVERDARRLLAELAAVPPRAGWFTETYCERARYFQPKNGARIEAIRDAIAAKDLPPALEAVVLTSLMEAADRVDSTTGVQMAWLKSWAARSSNELELRMPDVLAASTHGPCEAHRLDALEAAATLEADVAYVDPPYNQHSYLGNYHLWETLVRWDRPDVYGIACKRTDVRERRSAFNSKRDAESTLRALLERVRARALVVSFSDEGYVGRVALESMLRARGEVTVLERDHKRYVGAQIGIYSPRGEKVGKVSHLRNTEYLFVVAAA
jgi:adenine-specific DNA-methyltransferase